MKGGEEKKEKRESVLTKGVIKGKFIFNNPRRSEATVPSTAPRFPPPLTPQTPAFTPTPAPRGPPSELAGLSRAGRPRKASRGPKSRPSSPAPRPAASRPPPPPADSGRGRTPGPGGSTAATCARGTVTGPAAAATGRSRSPTRGWSSELGPSPSLRPRLPHLVHASG